ncbi:phage terminase large subunit family protein [Pelosinus sp. UFO1]|uniref:phage terminase large subunit family protein n=1 Tax=Pelosinus sp. UFO1 TaxID=484770 RepID=UPI0004D0D949|nr:phage terminase large subunit family protein [Pelosinus sp. UFO1]AIF51246.1 terminase GpA [Pelosinus sp. UFO1]
MAKHTNSNSKKTLNLIKNIARGFAPPPQLTVSEWADKNRILQSSSSSEPGPWRTDRVPYMREIMDCLSANSLVQNVCLMKGAQLSGSESGNNWIGYIIDQEPGPTMIVQPTIDLAKKYSKQRISPMITACPVLSNKIKPSRSRDGDNTVLTKEFPNGLLVITGANSAAGLRSMPAKNLFLDEVDAYKDDVEGEGDPVDLVMARTRTFNRRKVLKVSTPLVKGISRIENDYEEGDQRKYFVPCPECGHMHALEWANFIIPKDENGKSIPKEAHMGCPDCGSVIEEHHKPYMLQHGKWRMTVPENASSIRRSYHISTLYSPLGWFSWAEIAELWTKINKNKKRLKSFINTILGETFGEEGESVDHEILYENRRTVYEASLPEGVLVLTAAVDTQDDRLEYECVGWGLNKNSWGIEYGVFHGDPRQQAVWDDLDKWLSKQWSYADGSKLNISCTCIDSGGHATSEVYKFCKPREQRRVFAIKGKGGPGIPIVGRPSRNNRYKTPLFTLGVDAGKEAVYSRLKLESEEEHGFCLYPMSENGAAIKGYDLKYFKSLTVEKRELKYIKGKPRYIWVKPSGARNEALDIRNYATAALEILNPSLEILDKIRNERNVTPKKIQQSRKRRVLNSGVSV